MAAPAASSSPEEEQSISIDSSSPAGNLNSQINNSQNSQNSQINNYHQSKPPPTFQIASPKRIEIPDHVTQDSQPLWSNCFVGHFLGKQPFIGSVHATVNRIWNTKDKKLKIDAEYIAPRVVLFRLGNSTIRERVLQKKYWFISDIPMVVQEWSPSTAHIKPDLTQFPLWVEFESVPDSLFSREGLKFLADQVGTYQFLHPKTEKCVRLDAARVLTVVNLEQPLPEQLWLAGTPDHYVGVTYTGIPSRCAACAEWGHIVDECKASGSKTSPPEVTNKDTQDPSKDSTSQQPAMDTNNPHVEEKAEQSPLPKTLQEVEKLASLLADLEEHNVHSPSVSQLQPQLNDTTETNAIPESDNSEGCSSPRRPLSRSAAALKCSTERSASPVSSGFKVLQEESVEEVEQKQEEEASDEDSHSSDSTSPTKVPKKVSSPKKKINQKKKGKLQQKNVKVKSITVGQGYLKKSHIASLGKR